MKFEHIELRRRGRILTVALNRAERLNAFNALLHAELPRAIEYAAEDTESDVIILTGNGRAFSAGGDLGWQQEAADHPGMFEATIREAKKLVFGIIDCEKPIIAHVNGPAVGLGATIALLCDIVIAGDSAYFSDPHVSVGMVAGDGGAMIWPQMIGFARAKEYLLTGDKIAAPDAMKIGLINRSVPDSALSAEVDKFADRLASGAQMAIRYSKVTINVALRQLAGTIMDVGLGYESLTNISADHHEALAAFREKRLPCFDRKADPLPSG
jgi:enoyl-CoA hydratase